MAEKELPEKDLFSVIRDYESKFDSYPDVTTMHINEAGRLQLIKICEEAIKKNKALTEEEMLAFEHKYNAHLYEEGVVRLT